MHEFEAYISKRNSAQDKDYVLRQFKKADTDGSGYIDFIEFLRASCSKSGIQVPIELSVHDELKIFETCEWRHINAKKKAYLISELENLKGSVDPSYSTKKTVRNLAVLSVIVGLASVVAMNYNKTK